MKNSISKTYLFTIDNAKVYFVQGGGPYGIRNMDKRNLFIGGANWKAYNWMPKNEYWMERSVSDDEGELLFNLLHEIIETNLMTDKKMEYALAHQWANYFENQLRQHYTFCGLNTNSLSGMTVALLELAEVDYGEYDSEFAAFFGKTIGQYIMGLLSTLKI
jgi:hypothetical protein